MAEQKKSSLREKYALEGKIVSVIGLIVGFAAMYLTFTSGNDLAMWGGLGVMGVAGASTFYFS